MKKNDRMFCLSLPLKPQQLPSDALGNALLSLGFNSVLLEVGDWLQWESHPEIRHPQAFSKEEFKHFLDRWKKLGLTPLPKLNFSAACDDWLKVYSRMPGTRECRKVCADLMKECYELFSKPRYFHLGMDEETPENQANAPFSCVRRNGVLWKDVFHLFHTCETLGSQPWIWSDCYHRSPEEFFRNMPKSVLQSPRSHIATEKDYALWEESVEALDRAGYRYALCCSDLQGNDLSHRVMKRAKTLCRPQALAGFFAEPFCLNEELVTEALAGFQAAKEFYSS